MQKGHITKKQLKQLNSLVKENYFEILKSHFVWGVEALKSPDNNIYFEHLQGRFLGGGISESYGYKVIIKGKKFYTKNYSYALKSIYWYLVKTGKIVN